MLTFFPAEKLHKHKKDAEQMLNGENKHTYDKNEETERNFNHGTME